MIIKDFLSLVLIFKTELMSIIFVIKLVVKGLSSLWLECDFMVVAFKDSSIMPLVYL